MIRCLGSFDYHVAGLPRGFDDPVFKDRKQAEDWLTDRLPELSKRLKRGPRACLTCKKTFISEGHHNRRCDTCRGVE